MLTEIHTPTSLDSAIELVSNGAVPLGGGTVLMPRLNDYSSPPTALISLRQIDFGSIECDHETVTLAATTTLGDLETEARLPYLSDVVRAIASPPVRSLATVAGNIFAPAPYGDLGVALVALGAEIDLVDSTGPRTQSLESFLSERSRGEMSSPTLITHVRFRPPEPTSFHFLKAARRRLNSGAIATIAAVTTVRDDHVTDVRVALGGLAPHVVRALHVEEALQGRRLDQTSIERAAEAGRADISPLDDSYASAWYRARVFPVHLRRALLGH